MVIFNLLAGWLLITSYLVTTYQQYGSYMDAMGFDPEAERAAVKKKGNIFKRIIMAIKNKRKKKLERKELKEKFESGLVPGIVEDALTNMEKIEDIPKKDERR